MLNRNIFLCRSVLGYTQKDMAKFLTISQQAYSHVFCKFEVHSIATKSTQYSHPIFSF